MGAIIRTRIPISSAMSLAKLQAAQERLAALYQAQRTTLLPDEDNAFLSMLGKMQVLADFLTLPPKQAAHLPASGEGSMADAEQYAVAMADDVDKFVHASGH